MLCVLRLKCRSTFLSQYDSDHVVVIPVNHSYKYLHECRPEERRSAVASKGYLIRFYSMVTLRNAKMLIVTFLLLALGNIYRSL